MKATDIAEAIGQDFTSHGDYIVIRCYNTDGHSRGDQTPSLTVYDGERGYYCYSCGESGTHSWLLKQFGISKKGVTDTYTKKPSGRDTDVSTKNKVYKTYPLIDIHKTLDSLPKQSHKVLEAKGFTIGDFQNLAQWRWHVNQIPGWRKGAFIPYFSIDGKEMVGARIRMFSDTGPRFLSLPGGESFPYMWQNLTKSSVVFITEGETDTLTLMFLGIPAVGIPGSTNAEAIDKLMKEASKRNVNLIAVPDNDEAGGKFLERIRQMAFENFVRIDDVKIPEPYKDVNDFYTGSDPDLFTEFFLSKMEDNTILKPMLVPPTEQGVLL